MRARCETGGLLGIAGTHGAGDPAGRMPHRHPAFPAAAGKCPNVWKVHPVPRGNAAYRGADAEAPRIRGQRRRCGGNPPPRPAVERHRRLRRGAQCGQARAGGPGYLRLGIRGPYSQQAMRDRHAATGAVRGTVPGARECPGLHRTRARGRLRGRREDDPQGQPVPHGMRAYLRASLRGTLPPQPHRCAVEHSRHQEICGGQCARRYRGNPGTCCVDEQARCRHRRRPIGLDLRVLLRVDGPRRDGVRGPQAARGHAALRHPRLPLPARTARAGRERHPGRWRHPG